VPFVHAVGKVVHTLPEGETVCGVTLLAGEIYLLRDKDRCQVEVYDIDNYILQGCHTLPKASSFDDMTSCDHWRCIYIAYGGDHCIRRLDAKLASLTRWDVHARPFGLSVNAASNVLVACRDVRKIKEFSSRGELLREITLLIKPWHTIEIPVTREFIVCHGRRDDEVLGVCKISADSPRVVQSHGGKPGSGIGQYSSPRHLAVDDDGSVFVADFENKRVTLLSPTMEYVREIVSRDQIKYEPKRLHLDRERRLLYVADNQFSVSSGRIVVFRI